MNLRYTGNAPEMEASQWLCDTMETLFAEDQSVVYLDADLMASMKTQTLWEKYPGRVFNCGIQEANMVGVAAGMYLAGYKPYIHSFAPFITRRVFDQVFVSIAYAKKSVRLIGSDAGIMATDNGGTHMCFEDIALMRTIPNACIVDVTDGAMLGAMLKATKNWDGVSYIRTPRRNMPDVYTPDEPFAIGEGKLLLDGEDCTIVASGIMVGTALQAAALLKEENISVSVVDPVTIKPMDRELILQQAKKTGAIVTAENHNIMGGLGGCVAEIVSENYPVPVLRVGIQDCLGQVGNEAYLREVFHLRPEDITEKVHLAISMKK